MDVVPDRTEPWLWALIQGMNSPMDLKQPFTEQFGTATPISTILARDTLSSFGRDADLARTLVGTRIPGDELQT